MRALVLLSLLFTVCMSAGLVDMKNSAESIKGLIKERVVDKIKNTAHRIKEVLNNKMAAFKKRLSGFKDKILKKLTLTREQRAELLERLKLVKRRSTDKVQPMGDSIEEVNLQNHIAGALFQGDMVLTKEQEDQIIDDITNDGTRARRQALRDPKYPGMRWHEGVKYFFDSSASPQVKSVFKKAAAQWMADTCIDFKEVPNQEESAEDSIRVYMEDGCWSYVGRLGGIQNLSLGKGCETIGTAAHELGHAIGFFHTHARHDRDQFITVDTNNIESDWLDQFAVQTIERNDNYGLTYDYGSLMHYGATCSSMNKKPTMVPKDIQYMETLGSPFIGFYDLLMINKHYKCTDMCKGPSMCKNYGFPHPRDCKKCICPSGYGGPLCDRRPDGCGAELVATNKWQTLKDDLGDRQAGVTPREDFMKCNYWIKAPAGKKVQVKFVSFPKGIAVDGCTYAGVEIKTHPDQRLTGYRLCSEDDRNTTLTSTSNIVPVITYNRIYATVTILEYRYI